MRRRAIFDDGLAAGRRAVAASSLGRGRDGRPSCCVAPASNSQSRLKQFAARAAARSFSQRQLAGRDEAALALAVRRRCVCGRHIATTGKPSRIPRMAADRVATQRSRSRRTTGCRTWPASTPLKDFVAISQTSLDHRARLQELKQELGLGHYEGRGWRGFHHHATLCIAAYGFLVAERARFSPSARVGTLRLPVPEMPTGLPPPRRSRIRAERHNPHSIATLRTTIARHILRQLPCCPFCGSGFL